MIQTFVCDTCKKAIDLTIANKVILNPARCIITKGCQGVLSSTNSITVAPTQYLEPSDLTAWEQIPVLYTHDQVVARKTWLVNHNLNAQPMVQVYIGTSTTPANISSYTIDYISSSQLSISFNTATAGLAVCQVRPNTLPVPMATVQPNTANFIITANSVLTLAIPASASSISFNLATYVDSNTAPISSSTVTVTPNGARFAGPWRNYNSVLINGRKFNLADVSLNDVPSAIQTFSAAFNILNTDGVTPISGGYMYCLLSQDPYTDETDRILNEYVDVALLANPADTACDSLNLYCLEDLVQPTYPPIMTL